MDLSVKERIDKGIKSIRLMIDEAKILEEPYLSLEMKRLIQYEDVLVKVFGDEQYEEDFKWLKEDKGLKSFEEDKGYTRDEIYAIVKELEFRDKNMEKEGYFRRGFENLLELYSEIFNHWGSYEKLLKKEDKVPKTRAERRELGL